MKSTKRNVRGRRRPSRKALNTILDQLAQWIRPGAAVRLVISHGPQLLHIIGRLHKSPSVENNDASDILRGFDFTSLTGEIHVPLLPDLYEALRLESIGDETVVVMEDRTGSLSVRAFDLTKRLKPDAQDVEKAGQRLSTWVAAKTPVTMAVYGAFFEV